MLTLHLEYETTAPLRAAWAALSDTDRFNRLAGFDFTFEDVEGGRIGRSRRLGIDLTWDEAPFTIEAPHHFSVRRVFRGSPLAEYTQSVTLTEGERTHIAYTVELYPRNALATPLVKLDIETHTRPALEKALKAVVTELDGGPPASLDVPSVSAEQLDRLEEVAGARLREFVEFASLREQDRIHPRRLAALWDRPVEQAVQALLAAADAGLMEVHWELLCPSCQQPRATLRGGLQVHCLACTTYIDRALPDALVVSFRPASTLRQFSVPPVCAGNPGARRHILMQKVVQPGAALRVGGEMVEGAYRLRTIPTGSTASLLVGENVASSLELHWTRDGLEPPLLRADPGPGQLSVENRDDVAATVILERLVRPEGLMTVGELLGGWPQAAKHLPQQIQYVGGSTFEGCVAAIWGEGPVEGARWVYASDEGARVAVFGSVDQALDALAAPQMGQRIGLAGGRIAELGMGEQRVPAGYPVTLALSCAWGATDGGLAVSSEHRGDALDAALDARGWLRLEPAWPNRGGPPVHWVSR